MSDSNPMRDIVIEKLCLNICVGEKGDKVTKAAQVLKQISNQEVVLGSARITQKGWGVRRCDKISAYVTIRGALAEEIMKKGLAVKEFELPAEAFHQDGNFGFGIEEHIDLGLPYDPSTGIYGMDFIVVLARRGKRVQRRKRARAKIGIHHKISADEAKAWFVEKFGGQIYGN
eukprot:TRINITY_DN2229_c0_g1_i2.p1 TRINITY_DN2229_c0_g1~~TRINITY_DN2229_c0_g1_i2.p1  ORF type:complete len:173 (+),score=35.27 TRINITY_DN2229_c0_g1_i2:38-556(+)